MKRFFSVLALCFSLLLMLGLWLFPSVRAKEDPILTLLNLPAPPPPNPWVRTPAGSRPPEFYDKERPPPDDAAIEDLMEFWSRQSSGYAELGYNPRPSERVMGRILREIEKDPRRIADFLNLMQDEPRGVALARDHYKKLAGSGEDEDRETRRMLKRWLTANSDDFAEDLARGASEVKDVGDYVSNQDELLALTKVDWDRASPIVNRLYNDGSQKVSKTLATWALYRNAMRTGGGDVDRYRDELKAVVEDKTAGAGARDLALDALLKEKEWSGRDEWFYTLLEDETLHELKVNGQTYTGLTSIMYYTPDEGLVPKLIELTQSGNIAVRSAAVKNLVLRLNRMSEFERNRNLRTDIAKALLPWFRDPKWVREDPAGKQTLIRVMASVKLPEAVPALIAVLDEKDGPGFPRYASNANAAVSRALEEAANAANAAAEQVARAANAASNSAYVTTANSYSNRGHYAGTPDYYPYRDAAVRALAMQADGRAVPALRRVLTQVQEYERAAVVNALLASNGFTAEEQVAAIEFMARNAGDAMDGSEVEPGGYDYASAKGRARMALRTSISSRTTTAVEQAEPEGEDPDEEFESYGQQTVEEKTFTTSGSAGYADGPPKPMTGEDLSYMLGASLVQMDDPGDELVRGVVARIDAYEKREPLMAETLRKIMLGWKGRAVNALLLRDLKAGRIDPDAVVKLLAIRKQLREEQSADVTDARNGVPAAQGIAVCLSEDAAAAEGVLDGGSDAAKAAMLACARLIRIPLTVAKAASNLKSPNKLLAIAAERYLEAEDSPEAREIILSLYPNQAKILGAKTSFEPDGRPNMPGKFLYDVFRSVNPYYAAEPYAYSTHSYGQAFVDAEKRLRKEVLGNAELVGVYAYDDHFVHIYKDRVVFSWSDDPARYRERVLEQNEWDNLKGFLAHHNVDQLPPFLACTGECDSYELLMLSKRGGRRVFMKTSDPLPDFVAGLDKIFDEMRSRPAKLKYYAGATVPGLEVHFEDDELAAKSVWKEGADIRVLVTDESRSKAVEKEIADLQEKEEDAVGAGGGNDQHYQKFFNMREARKFDSFGWFRLTDGTLGGAAPQPAQSEYIPVSDGVSPTAAWGRWKARTATFEIRADDQGLHKIAGGRAVRIRSGNYSDPVMTANGRWVVATKYSENSGPMLVRVNLLNNRELPVPSESSLATKPLAYVPALNLVLLTGLSDGDHEEEYEYGSHNASASDYGRGYSFFNPDTGAVTSAAGEVRPVAQQTFRGLQPTGVAGEHWAALPRGTAGTLVGTYNTRSLTFKPVLKLPKIIFDSTEMWVDGGRVWFAYQGHVLSAPIK